MAAVSAAGDPQLQQQLLEWLLRPVHQKWSDQRWLAHLESPAAFAAEFMQYELVQGSMVIGSRCGGGEGDGTNSKEEEEGWRDAYSRDG
jgi:hypothetical protein